MNKLSFQLQLKQFDNALITANNLIRIKPNVPDYYVTIGLLYEMTADSVLSNKYFTEAGIRFDKILDTIDIANKDRNMLLILFS